MFEWSATALPAGRESSADGAVPVDGPPERLRAAMKSVMSYESFAHPRTLHGTAAFPPPHPSTGPLGWALEREKLLMHGVVYLAMKFNVGRT